MPQTRYVNWGGRTGEEGRAKLKDESRLLDRINGGGGGKQQIP